MQNQRRDGVFDSAFCIHHSAFTGTRMTEATIPPAPSPVAVRARWLLTFFLLTFLLSRIIVLLVMTRRLPDLFLCVGGTDVHHLNYGIVLLSAAGTWALVWAPGGARLKAAVASLGVGLGLTFDEFGMWV